MLQCSELTRTPTPDAAQTAHLLRQRPHLAPEVHVVAVFDESGQHHHSQLRLYRARRPRLLTHTDRSTDRKPQPRQEV